MSDPTVQMINQMIARMPIPEETAITPEATARFEQAVEVMYAYRGEPQALIEGLKAYLATRCRPYVYAGIAGTLSTAAFEHDDQYDQEGVEQALTWLQRAQEIIPDRNEINLFEAIIYLHMKRYPDARTVLDYLAEAGPLSYRFCITEMSYWDAQKDMPKVEEWFEQAIALARGDQQRAYLLEMLAGIYLMNNILERSLRLFEEAVKFASNNPWAWHNMSVIHYRQRNYDPAARCNERALQLMDFGAARQMQALIPFGRGRVADEAGNFADALRYLDQSLQLDPTNAGVLSYRGLVRKKSGQLDKALADFTEVIRLKPQDADAYVNRGQAYEQKKDRARAQADYEAALRINPQLTAARSSLEDLSKQKKKWF
jgi:tetratricopeptide (TPR) repeat protein